MGFEKKTVLVTGASSGIGAAAAIHLASLGAKVSIVGRNAKRLNEVAEQINKSAGCLAPLQIQADVTTDAERIIDETIKHFGKLDVLVNNAGIAAKDNICDLNIAEFDRVFDTNVRSVIKLTQAAIPHLELTKGNIVNVSSIAGLKPIQGLTGYGIAKAALDQLTKCCSLDLAPKGIRVNAVCPAVIKTPIFQKFGFTQDGVEQLYEQVKSTYPVGRVGEVSDTNTAIAFLADNEVSSFLTGILLPVDGGSMVAGVGYKK